MLSHPETPNPIPHESDGRFRRLIVLTARLVSKMLNAPIEYPDPPRGDPNA